MDARKAPADGAPRARRATVQIARIGVGAAVMALLGWLAAPYALAPVAASIASSAIAGSLEIGSIALSPFEGGVVLDDVELFDAADPPQRVATIERVEAHLELSALRRRSVHLLDLALREPLLEIDRLGDGRLNVLDALQTVPRPAEEPPSPRWGVAVDRVMLDGARLRFRDFLVSGSEPEPLDLQVTAFRIDRLAAAPGAYDEPTLVHIEGAAEGATLVLDATLRPLQSGFAADARVSVGSLPLRRAYLYAGVLGPRELRGVVDVEMAVSFEPDVRSEAAGAVVLREVEVRAPGQKDPALHWKSATVALRKVDLRERRAEVDLIVVEEPVLLAALDGTPAIPLLAPAPATPATQVAPRPQTATPQTAEPPWRWSVSQVELRDVTLRAQGGRAPLELRGRAVLRDLADDLARPFHAELSLAHEGGSVELNGRARAAPPGFAGKVDFERIELPSLLGKLPEAWVPASPVLVSGRASGRLDLAAGLPASSATSATPAADAAVSSAGADEVLVAGLLSLEDGKLAFGQGGAATARFDRLDLRLREARLARTGDVRGETIAAGTLSISAGAASLWGGEDAPSLTWDRIEAGAKELRVTPPPAGSGAGPRVHAELARVDVMAPRTRVTRREDGLLIPAAAAMVETAAEAAPAPAPPPSAESAPAAPTTPAPTPAEGGPPGTGPIDFEVDLLRVENGEITVMDRTVKPFYRGTVTALAGTLRDLRWPARSVGAIDLKGRFTGDSSVALTGSGALDAKGMTLVADAKRVPLPPFNPYLAPRGYNVAAGAGSVVSSLWIGPLGFEAKNWLVLHGLEVTGDRGESLFEQEYGVSLSYALTLLRDWNGDVSITIPVWLDRKGLGVGVGDAIRSAIGQAIVGALSTPIKLIGSIIPSGANSRPRPPRPIPFPPGQSALDEAGVARVDELALLLMNRPPIVAVLRGVVGAEDAVGVTAAEMAEAERRRAQRAESEQPGFLSRIGRVLGVGGRRGSDQPAPDAWDPLREFEPSDDPKRLLARERARAVFERLQNAYGVEDWQVAIPDEAVPRPGEPGVVVGLRPWQK